MGATKNISKQLNIPCVICEGETNVFTNNNHPKDFSRLVPIIRAPILCGKCLNERWRFFKNVKAYWLRTKLLNGFWN